MSLNPVIGLLRVDPLKDHLLDVVVQLNNVLDLFDFDTVISTSIYRLLPSGGSCVRRLTPMLMDPLCCIPPFSGQSDGWRLNSPPGFARRLAKMRY